MYCSTKILARCFTKNDFFAANGSNFSLKHAVLFAIISFTSLNVCITHFRYPPPLIVTQISSSLLVKSKEFYYCCFVESQKKKISHNSSTTVSYDCCRFVKMRRLMLLAASTLKIDFISPEHILFLSIQLYKYMYLSKCSNCFNYRGTVYNRYTFFL